MKLKRFILIFSLFFFIGLLASCGKEKAPSLQDRLGSQEQAMDSFEGTIEGISKDVYQQGTHQLKDEEGEVVFLQSPTINLNKYIGQHVLVRGEMKRGIGNSKPVLVVSKVESIKDDQGGSDQEGVKLYENESLGFQFEYPKAWLLESSGGQLTFSFQEEALLQVDVFSHQSNLNTFVMDREGEAGSTVTVAAQSARRLIAGDDIVFYVQNPSQKSIYRLQFAPSAELKASDDLDGLKSQFYDLVQSFQLIYTPKQVGQSCGGEPPVACPDDYFCELNDDSDFAEGVCVQIGSTSGGSCPIITPPSDCAEFRISDYSQNGCPAAYACVDGDESSGSSEGGDGANADASGSEVSQDYTNEKLGFSMRYPKGWYYVSFGSVEGNVGTIGFADQEFEDREEAIITLDIQSTDGGKASKKVGEVYYTFNGPSNLISVMQEMASSVQ